MAIADKLQKLIDGKQYVIDKTNTKAESDLKINSTWKSIGDTIEAITTGGGGTDITDATATASDIRIGKTAYISSGKVEGTIEDYDGSYEGEAATPSGGVVEVEELPTENVQEDTLYKTNEVSDINVYVKTGTNNPTSLQQAIESLGATPNLTYYLVNALPDTPNISNLQTFNPAYVYIYNDIAYTYGNAGYGNMWLGVKDLISSTIQIAHEDKGYVSSPVECGEQGIYVSYKLGTYGIKTNKSKIVEYEDEWIDYKSIFDKSIVSFSHSSIISLGNSSFRECKNLKKVILNNVIEIGAYAFHSCHRLNFVKLPKIKTIDSHAFSEIGYYSECHIYLGYEGVVELQSRYTFNQTYVNAFPITIHVRNEYLADYQSNEYWMLEVSDSGITLVGDYTD